MGLQLPSLCENSLLITATGNKFFGSVVRGTFFQGQIAQSSMSSNPAQTEFFSDAVHNSVTDQNFVVHVTGKMASHSSVSVHSNDTIVRTLKNTSVVVVVQKESTFGFNEAHRLSICCIRFS